MAFAFLGKKGEPGETTPCLVVKDANSKMRVATKVPTKSVDQFVVKRAIAFLAEVGCLHGDAIVQSDQEPAIQSLAGENGRHRAGAGGGRWVEAGQGPEACGREQAQGRRARQARLGPMDRRVCGLLAEQV